MEEALWEYRMPYRMLTQEIPYPLAFGVEAVFPLECQIPPLRLAIPQKVCLMCFQVGDQVIELRRPIITSHKSGQIHLEVEMGICYIRISFK